MDKVNKKIYQWDLKLISVGEKWKNACYVKLPFTDLKAEFGRGNLVPIKVIFDHKIDYRGVISKYDNEVILVVVIKVQEALKKHAGDVIHIKLQYDDQPKTTILPKDLKIIIDKSGLLDAWRTLSNSMQREYVSAYLDAKKPETKNKRVQEIINHLKDKKSNSI